MEKNIAIPTNDGHLIYGTLNYKDETKNRLAIFIHGLSDHKDCRLPYNATKFFKSKGFHTFRFSLYSDENKARSLDESSISTFKEDINSVFDYFKGDYKEVYLICHSLGFVALDCDLKYIKKIAFWEPALALKDERMESISFEPKIDAYLIDWGVNFIISKQLKAEWENINDERLLRNLKTPLLILMAENSYLKVGWKENLKYLKAPYVYKEIGGASHTFWEEGKEEKIFEETLKWFRKT